MSEGFTGQLDEFRAWTPGRSVPEFLSTRTTRYFNPANYPNLGVQLTFDEAAGPFAFNTADPFPSSALLDIQGAYGWVYEDRDAHGRTDLCHPLCDADFDGNGVVNSTDVSVYFNTWFSDQAAGTLNADVDGSGVSSATDVNRFLNDYFAAPVECF